MGDRCKTDPAAREGERENADDSQSSVSDDERRADDDVFYLWYPSYDRRPPTPPRKA